jgi:ankyrin repeat protein
MGSKVSKMGEEFLIAAAGRQEAVVRLLLGKGANVATKDKNGRTALHFAAAGRHEAVVRLLLEMGAVSIYGNDSAGESISGKTSILIYRISDEIHHYLSTDRKSGT